MIIFAGNRLRLFKMLICMNTLEQVGNTNVMVCSKQFPKDYQIKTEMTEFSYPIYRRRAPKDGGRTAEIKRRGKMIIIDNQSIVPYNPFLLLKYDCHINVEIVVCVVSVKYLYKYTYKGHDRATLEFERNEVHV